MSDLLLRSPELLELHKMYSWVKGDFLGHLLYSSAFIIVWRWSYMYQYVICD